MKTGPRLPGAPRQGQSNAEILRRLRIDAELRGDCRECRCRPAKVGFKTCQHCLDAHYTRRTKRGAS